MSLQEALDIAAHVRFDNSITRYQFQVHQPLASTTYSYNDEIRFQVQNQDQYSLPSGSILLIEGKINLDPGYEKAKEEDPDPESFVQFVRNGIAFLFQDCRYLLNGVEIDSTRSLGYTTLIKGLCSFTPTEHDAYEDAGWADFPSKLHSTKKEAYFSVAIPLKLWLGFAEDHKRIIYSARQDLVLVRARNDKDALYALSGIDKSTVQISKISWMLPIIELNDEARVSLLSITKKDPPLSIGFRSWEMHENPALACATSNNWTVTTTTQLEKPRFVIVAFQTNRKQQIDKNSAIFDDIDVKDIKLFLNSEVYPYANMDLNFQKKQISFLYYLYATFQQSYYNREICSPLLDRDDFIKKGPFFVFDTCYQNDRLKNSVPVDIRLEIQTATSVPANTTCFCLILHDRVVEYTPISGITRRI